MVLALYENIERKSFLSHPKSDFTEEFFVNKFELKKICVEEII